MSVRTQRGRRLVAAAALLALFGCTDFVERTRVVVFIDADGSVRDEIDHVDIEVRSGSLSDNAWETRESRRLVPGGGAKAWPIELTLDRKDSQARDEFLVSATAIDAAGKAITEVRAISGYIRGRTLELSMRFDVECALREAPCSDAFSCREGACIDPFVEAEALPERPDDETAPPRPSEPMTTQPTGTASAPGTAPTCPNGTSCTPATSPCAADHGGCDDLVRCSVPKEKGEVVCGPCPPGFSGDGRAGCVPVLTVFGSSAGALQPAFDPAVEAYEISLPLMAARVELQLEAADDVEIAIGGERVPRGEPWSISELAWGDNAFQIELTIKDHASRTYNLVLRRDAREIERLEPPPEALAGAEFGSALAFDGDYLAVGAPGEAATDTGQARSEAGAVYVYAKTGEGWEQAQRLTATTLVQGARFGDRLAFAGGRLAVSARTDGAGAVYVFERRGDSWEPAAELRPDPNRGDGFGAALALEGDRLAIGAPADGTGTSASSDPSGGGAVYVFERSATGSWERRARLKATTPGPQDWLGSSIALQGDLIASGATGETIDGVISGGAHLFYLEGAEWQERLPGVQPSHPESLVFFGETLGLAGDTLVAGSSTGALTPNAGKVHVYQRHSGDAFDKQQELQASNAAGGDYFGGRILLTHDTLVIGASHEATAGEGIAAAVGGTRESSGAAYVFTRRDGSWVELLRIKGSPSAAQDQFGFGLAANAETLAVSAIGAGGGAGRVTLYR